MRKLIYILLLCGLSAQAQFTYLASQQQYENEGGAFDSGLILNGTFDDSSDLTAESNWSISGGVASFDGGTGGQGLNLDLESTVPTGTDVTLTLTTSNEIGTVRFLLNAYDIGYGYSAEMIGFTTYTPGEITINFTTADEGGMGGTTTIEIHCSSASDAFDIDNVSYTID